MTAFEWGLAIGSILGIVIGVCLAIIMIKVEGRRERRMGYVNDPVRNDPVRQFRHEISEMRRKQDPKTKLGTRRTW